MSDQSGRQAFLVRRKNVEDAFRWLLDLTAPGANADGQALALAEELDVRDALTSYAAALDAKDTSRAGAHFATDALLVTPEATFSGRNEIDRFHTQAGKDAVVAFHHIANVVIRTNPSSHTAWFAARIHAPSVNPDRAEAHSHFAVYFGRMVKSDRWLFSELDISSPLSLKYQRGALGAGALSP